MYDQTRAQQPADNRSGSAGRRTTGPEPLLPSDERAELTLRLQHALNTFADSPREALEEAEGAFDEAIARLMNTLAERRRDLHEGWRDPDPEKSDALRFALREYREITQRLLRL
ncbi:hypothetical protein AB0I77_39225 [Streptomyces sp. NPDC050619]|uniref:hypothetical protein n=1 Tax=Streptomyces sp. NPDC050619 TaxID=3157214 RepID=UPI00341CD796